MSHEFSKREKILLLILVLGLIVFAWYKFIYSPINDEITSLNSITESEQSETELNLVKIQEMKKMESETEELKASGEVDEIPLYDNYQALMVSLNKVLLPARSYNLDFDDVTSKEYIVSRPVSLVFTSNSYSEARMIIDQLYENSYCNQISDVVINTDTGASQDLTKVSLNITFYEIME